MKRSQLALFSPAEPPILRRRNGTDVDLTVEGFPQAQ